MSTYTPISAIQAKVIYDGKKDELMEAAQRYHGNLKLIADDCSLTTRQVNKFYKDHPEFKEVVDDARDALYETASAKLGELIDKGNFNALNLFFSKSPQAKSRGWGERTEQDQHLHLDDAEKAEAAKRMLGMDGDL